MSAALDVRTTSVQRQPTHVTVTGITVRPLHEHELSHADNIFRLAFGTFIGLPDPSSFFQAREFVYPRWQSDPFSTLGAEMDGQLIGSNFIRSWGSVGFFGPSTVHPDFWDQGVAKALLEPTMELLNTCGIRHAGLFTFPHSQKHVGLYEWYGFHARFLTAVMTKPASVFSVSQEPSRFSALTSSQQLEGLRACRELSESVFAGLDLEKEIRAVQQYKLGETLFLWDDSQLMGFAVCHYGERTEGGPQCCYVKFAAVRPGPDAGNRFEVLLDACESLASAHGLANTEAGVSLARDDAYRRMQARGYRTAMLGVAMHKPNEQAYHRPDAYVIDDWR